MPESTTPTQAEPRRARHSLSAVNLDDGTAMCAVCGPTQIRRIKSRKTQQCMTLRREHVKKYKRQEQLRKKYGINVSDFDAMAAEQNDACAICRVVPDETLVVDHDHATGAVRQLLCRRCNLALGFLKDDRDVLASAMEYLARHAAA